MPKEKYKLKILTPAREEIRAIARLHTELVGVNSARKITETLRKSIEHLCDHPYLGVTLEERDLSQLGYRKLISGKYLCFYRLIGDTIFVYHIADGRTEYKQLFRNLPR